MTCELGSPGGVVLGAVLTCPHCGHATHEDMPVDACQFFCECQNCKTLLRPKPDDCCVFCSYGSVKCPPVQVERRCCGNGLPGLPAARAAST